MSLKDLRDEIHQENLKWWTSLVTGEPIKRNRKELLSLVITEISECLEGERKNLMDDKLPHRKMAEVEMADAYIRLMDFAGGFGLSVRPVPYDGTIPDNKGEAMFELTELVIRIGNSSSSTWLNVALAYIDAYCRKHNYHLLGAITEKRAFNRTRKDHSHEARKAGNGKKF